MKEHKRMYDEMHENMLGKVWKLCKSAWNQTVYLFPLKMNIAKEKNYINK